MEAEATALYADRLAALGSEPRLRIIRLLLAAHPTGMFAGDIQAETGITASNLSHHLEKLRNEDLVTVQREGTFLRYRANAGALREVVDFLYAECCSRRQVIPPEQIAAATKGKKA